MLKTATFQTTIPLDRTLTLTLPADMPTGEVEIVIVVASAEPTLHHIQAHPPNSVIMSAPSYSNDDYTINANVDPATVEAFGDSDNYTHQSDEPPQFASNDEDIFYP